MAVTFLLTLPFVHVMVFFFTATADALGVGVGVGSTIETLIFGTEK